MKTVHLLLEPQDKVYLVFAAKRLGYNDNIVLLCEVDHVSINREKMMIYTANVIKNMMNKKENVKKYCHLFFQNANINTGYKGNGLCYPVFTRKEDCIKWLKG